MLHRATSSAAGLVVATVAFLGQPTPTAAGAPTDTAVPSAAPVTEFLATRSASAIAALTFGPCTFAQLGDPVHVSATAFEASGHGWWVNNGCDTLLADVTVNLQQYYSDGSWRNRGTTGSARVYSGGGAGERATGRAACDNGFVTGWRSVIDVDLVGIVDSPEVSITAVQNIQCRDL